MNRVLIFLFLLSGQNVCSRERIESNSYTLNGNFKSWINASDQSAPSVSDNHWAGVSVFDNSEVNYVKNEFITNSLLASGRWVKVQTSQSGIHRITFSALKSMGFASPQKVKIFGFPSGQLPTMNSSLSSDDLTQYCTLQTKDKQANDCLLVHIPGNLIWRFDPVSGLYIPDTNRFAQGRSFLFLTEDTSSELPILQASSPVATPLAVVSEFDDFALFELEDYNLIQSGSRWFSSQLTSGNTFSQTFKFQDHVPDEPYRISVAAAGRCESPTSLNISVNNSAIGTLNFVPYSNFAEADFADLKEQFFTTSQQGNDLALIMKYNAPVNAMCWLDYIRVQTRRKLNMQNGQMEFCDSRSVKKGSFTEFRLGNVTGGIRVWDITSPLKPFEIQSVTASGALSFKVVTDSLRRFIAFDPLSDFPGVEKPEEVPDQNLHSLATPDMVIVTPAVFRSEADRLASYHRSSGMDVSVVNVTQIYNEFSGGTADPTAIRNFMRMLYYKSVNNAVSKLKYLLLFGKGTYDNIHPVSADNPCYIPAWQSENSINPVGSFVSDDYFGLLGVNEGNQTGTVDIGIGRIPCTTLSEAKAVVDKTLHYRTPSTMGDWRNVVCFVGDDEDGNIHVAASESLANFLNQNYPAIYTDKIYLDAFRAESTPVKSYPEVNRAINRRISEGSLIFNYTGHANEEALAQEKILTISDIDSWSNSEKLPVFVTATCEFSRWDMKNKQSAGEHVLFNKVGGGIALFSTTRLVYASSNSEINKSFFRYVFEKDKEGNDLRMGDIIRLAKNELGESVNASKFGLLGDPALRINYPEYRVKTLEINDQVAGQFNDTVRPLDLVSVWGEIQNLKGEKIRGYDGLLYPSVFDKDIQVKTFGNNGQTPFDYKIQNSVLFKGVATVKAGEFSWSFKVPKEISYRIGNGLIRYYSNSQNADASGSYTEWKLGGSPKTLSGDVNGPNVKLYLDDESFRPGDKVSKSPLLIAYLEDDSGINTAGSGIGHDITAIIDKQTSRMIILNDYFQSGQDSYKNGKVIAQLPELTDGEHTLLFKVWDLANNPSEVEVRFYVLSNLIIRSVTACPNPFKDYTDIYVNCNRFEEKMSVLLEVFNQQGVLVDQLKTESASSGFTTLPVRWNPAGNNRHIAPGIYHYRLRLTAIDGSMAVKTGQLILIQ